MAGRGIQMQTPRCPVGKVFTLYGGLPSGNLLVFLTCNHEKPLVILINTTCNALARQIRRDANQILWAQRKITMQLLELEGVEKMFPADVIKRAKEYLDSIPGGTGAYSDSQGALIIREQIAKV